MDGAQECKVIRQCELSNACVVRHAGDGGERARPRAGYVRFLLKPTHGGGGALLGAHYQCALSRSLASNHTRKSETGYGSCMPSSAEQFPAPSIQTNFGSNGDFRRDSRGDKRAVPIDKQLQPRIAAKSIFCIHASADRRCSVRGVALLAIKCFAVSHNDTTKLGAIGIA